MFFWPEIQFPFSASMASQRQVLKYIFLSLNILPASHLRCTSYVKFREYYLFRLVYEY